MGYMRHHAIVVTSWNSGMLEMAHSKAKEIFQQVAPITPETVNGYVSFLIAPDGSKEGWDHSDTGDRCRDEFIAWLDSQRYEDNSTSLQYVEIQFGDDNGFADILRHDDDERFGREL
jgi:hypothetical protein